MKKQTTLFFKELTLQKQQSPCWGTDHLEFEWFVPKKHHRLLRSLVVAGVNVLYSPGKSRDAEKIIQTRGKAQRLKS